MSGFVPPATATDLGVVQPDNQTIIADGAGVVHVPVATPTAAGIVKPDNETILVDDAGGIQVPLATTSVPGLVMPDGATIIEPILGQIAAAIATDAAPGVVQPDGTSITVDDAGVIATAPLEVSDGTHTVARTTEIVVDLMSVAAAGEQATITPMAATAETLGVVRPDGTTIDISDAGVISAPRQGIDLTAGGTTIDGVTALTVAPATLTGTTPDALLTIDTATADSLGVVQPDGTTIHVDDAGVISAAPAGIAVSDGTTTVEGVTALTVDLAIVSGTSPDATVTIKEAAADQLGVCSPDGTTIVASSGVLSATAVGLPAGSAGEILHHGASAWGGLAAGAAGDVLTSSGSDVSYQPLPVATSAAAGTVKPDGSTVDVADDGTISVPTATATSLGISRPDDTTIFVDDAGVLHVGSGATTAVLVSSTAARAKSLWNGSGNDAPPSGWQETSFDASSWGLAVVEDAFSADHIWPETPAAAHTESALVRQTFTVPTGATNPLLNYFAETCNGVYINGHLVPGSVGNAADTSGVAIPTAWLVMDGTTANVIAVQETANNPASPTYNFITYSLTIAALAPLPAALEIAHGGTPVGTEKILNFIDGAGATLSVLDNPGSQRVDVTISASGGSGGILLQEVLAEQTADNTGLTATTQWTDYPNLTASITTSGSGHRLRVIVAGAFSLNATSTGVEWAIKVNSTYYPLGHVWAYNGTTQLLLSGLAVDTPASAGAQTVKLAYALTGGSLNCRPASFPTYERMRLLVAELGTGSGGGGGGGSTLTVEDTNANTVGDVTTIDFSGATVSDAGGGQANVLIPTPVIFAVEQSGGTGVIDFTAIPQTARTLRFYGQVRSNSTAGTTENGGGIEWKVTLNGISSGGYWTYETLVSQGNAPQSFYATGGGAIGLGGGESGAYAGFGGLPNDADTGHVINFELVIPYYALGAAYPSVIFEGAGAGNAGQNGVSVRGQAQDSSFKAAGVSRVTFSCNSGNFSAGSKIVMEGLN